MRANWKIGVGASYVIAIAVPIAFTFGWKNYYPLFQGVIGYTSLVLVALIARFLGFRAALAATVIFAVALPVYLLPAVFPGRPVPFLLIRVVLFIAAAVTIASISYQRATEVHDAEEQYRLLFDAAPDAILICDQQEQIRFANPALVQLFGADAETLIGRKLVEFVHIDSVEVLQQGFAELAATGRLWAIEMKWIMFDGRTIDVEIAGSRTQRNGEELFQLFVRDVTASKNAEAMLDATARRMGALFDAAIDGIVGVDSTGRYVDANPAASRLLGYTREEFLTMRLGDLLPPSEKESITTIWNDGGRGETRVVRKDGEIRDLAYSIVFDVLPGFHCAFLQDITARKEAERAVQRLSANLLQLQDEERRRIARQLHDTTAQNLAAIRLNLSIVRRSLGSASAAVSESLDESIALTNASIGEIRTLAYLLHPPMIEESGLLASLRWFAQGFEARSGIRVTLDFPEELSRLPIEMETAIFRIVQEGLTNIQRHSGSTVAGIRIERPPDVLRLQIEDQGRGLPLHLRGDDVVIAAAGVGIASIRERVRELGGTLTVQSGDGGTLLNVTLPLPEN
jgi:PAS domain S-box-containing protein